MIKKDFVIIGGGVAGLCAANRLSELGASPLLIEGSHYPSHKVCGEFFSPHCLSILEKWNIFPLLLSKAYFRTLKHSIEFPFPSPAGALSHFTFDYQLVNRAQHLGAEILIHTKVERILYKENLYHVHLSSQESVVTPSLLVATGRIPHLYSSPSSFPYIGIKAHFKNLSIEKDRLEMFSLPGGYMGMFNRRRQVQCRLPS
jgi:menaquinone-9 beta-reductase